MPERLPPHIDAAHGARFNREPSQSRELFDPGGHMSIVASVKSRIRQVLLTGVVALAVALPALGQPTADERWVATWATALVARPLPPAAPPGAPPAPAATAPSAATPSGAPAAPPAAAPPRPPAPTTLTNQTLRQVVHTSVGGDRVRVVLSNVFGTAPLEVAAGAVALRDQGSAVRAGSVRELTFSGRKSATILAGATLVSDSVDIELPAVSDLVVDLYLPGDLGLGPSPVTTHNGASQTNYLSTTGNHVGAQSLPLDKETNAWFLLARVEVNAATNQRAVVAFGDSITDGARSTANAN